ncbi:hypothetical protein IEQ34_013174 [Dendrobium chrysotoxum]|uniref:Uncharacterized protein n=1 Tax=Dendrobium chrysotoxum TaxID=161865 RepID=A0AAV7G7N8_DENCH|nr:hypothetical protein IEQ34_013174 [Dendrobium chrysotoxum]
MSQGCEKTNSPSWKRKEGRGKKEEKLAPPSWRGATAIEREKSKNLIRESLNYCLKMGIWTASLMKRWEEEEQNIEDRQGYKEGNAPKGLFGLKENGYKWRCGAVAEPISRVYDMHIYYISSVVARKGPEEKLPCCHSTSPNEMEWTSLKRGKKMVSRDRESARLEWGSL